LLRTTAVILPRTAEKGAEWLEREENLWNTKAAKGRENRERRRAVLAVIIKERVVRCGELIRGNKRKIF
jgi:hypothetical protein